MITIPVAVVRTIEAHAREAFPEECCGVLFGHAGETRRAIEARPLKNLAEEDRARRYVIDPLDLLRADEAARAQGLDLIGIYHSHPNHPAEPSEVDRSLASSWYSYLILSIVNRRPKELTAWRFDEAAGQFHPDEVLRGDEP